MAPANALNLFAVDRPSPGPAAPFLNSRNTLFYWASRVARIRLDDGTRREHAVPTRGKSVEYVRESFRGSKRDSAMAKPNRFAPIWKDMKKAVEAQDHEGWSSPEVERATKMLLQALWICAHNPEHPVLLEILNKHAAELERVKNDGER